VARTTDSAPSSFQAGRGPAQRHRRYAGAGRGARPAPPPPTRRPLCRIWSTSPTPTARRTTSPARWPTWSRR